METNSQTIALCIEGTRLEFQGKLDEARQQFARAWECARDDYEKCVAAHYVGHLAQSPADALLWHQTALEHANRAEQSLVESFLPSLLVNLGQAHEQLGHTAVAQKFYQQAAALGLVHKPGSAPKQTYVK